MKKYLFFVSIVFILTNCHQNRITDNRIEQAKPIVIGYVDSIYSNILEEPRKIWIHVPESVEGENQDKKYPVVYLLDGPSNFYSVTGMIKKLSNINFNTLLPEMIVVAIPNTNRDRDLLPSFSDFNLPADDYYSERGGEGEKFLDFFEVELIPFIEKRFPTAPIRTYIGHSLGGLSVLNALIKKPYLFNNYISIDPSLQVYDFAFANYIDSLLNINNFENKALYVAFANNMGEKMEIQDYQNDTTFGAAVFRASLQFVQSIENNAKNGLRFEWKYYINENHASVPLISVYDGLHFLFQWYNFDVWKIYNHFDEMSDDELLELPKAHFKEISRHFGFEVLPPQELINNLGYTFQGSPERALLYFDYNVTNYPDSPNVYDSRGECYLVLKDTLKALEDFKKAFELDNKVSYKEKIEKLEQSIKN